MAWWWGGVVLVLGDCRFSWSHDRDCVVLVVTGGVGDRRFDGMGDRRARGWWFWRWEEGPRLRDTGHRYEGLCRRLVGAVQRGCCV